MFVARKLRVSHNDIVLRERWYATNKLEIYNETVNDLLSGKTKLENQKINLQFRLKSLAFV